MKLEKGRIRHLNDLVARHEAERRGLGEQRDRAYQLYRDAQSRLDNFRHERARGPGARTRDFVEVNLPGPAPSKTMKFSDRVTSSLDERERELASEMHTAKKNLDISQRRCEEAAERHNASSSLRESCNEFLRKRGIELGVEPTHLRHIGIKL